MDFPSKSVAMMSLLLCSVCKAGLSDVSQSASFQVVAVGDSATFSCQLPLVTRLTFWCRVTTVKRLEPVAIIDTFYSFFSFKQKSDRFSVKYDRGNTSLTIRDTVREDAGTYYCLGIQLSDVYFGRGTFLMIQGVWNIGDTVVQTPNSRSIPPGESVYINCSVHSFHCAAAHVNVMWLKNSVHSAPEIIHSSGTETSACYLAGSRETVCVHDYSMQNLTADDAGVYYCVVTVCGQLLFGNGTRVQIQESTKSPSLSLVVITLILTNCFSVLVALVLVWGICGKRARPFISACGSSDEPPESSQLREAPTYITVSHAPSNMSRRATPVRHNSDTVVYSEVQRCQ